MVSGASVIAVRVGLGILPRLVTRQQLAGVAATAGIGFTVALFVADPTFPDRAAQDEAKVGILVASAVAATLGWLLFTVSLHLPGRRWPAATRRQGRPAPPRQGADHP